MNIAISRAGMIAAAAVITPQTDARYYLNGILIEKHAKKGVIIVTTDGHRMLACHDEHAEFSDDMPVIVRFEKEVLAMARKPANLDKPLFITSNDGDKSVSVDIGGITFCNGGEVLAGNFPDWRRVCPKQTGDSAAACYDAAYLADWSPVSRYLAINGNVQAITIRAEDKASSAAVFFYGVDYAFGVIMPMRDHPDAMTSIPAWASSANSWEALDICT